MGRHYLRDRRPVIVDVLTVGAGRNGEIDHAFVVSRVDRGILDLFDEHVLDHVLPGRENGAIGHDVAEPARESFRKVAMFKRKRPHAIGGRIPLDIGDDRRVVLPPQFPNLLVDQLVEFRRRQQFVYGGTGHDSSPVKPC